MEENTQNKNELKYSQVFDWACKTIMNMSHKSIVNFINGLFQKNYPENSKISFNSTEFIHDRVGKLFADFLLSIEREKYHIEFQLQKDEKENEIILHFAETKVIYLQVNKHIPENYIIRFKMPNGEEFCYEVPVIQLLAKEIPEIVEEKLVLLLPLYQLKMRNITRMTPENRKKHIQEFKNMLEDMQQALQNSLADGLISGGDYTKLLNVTGTLYKYLYINTENMEEVDDMVEEKFTTYMEDIEQKIIKRATEQGMEQGMKITYLITKNPGLSDEEISSQTGNDIETIHKIRKELMEII